MYTSDIEGWMSPKDLTWLFQTAKEMKSIVEVGSWCGRSTEALLTGCSYGTVYAVDHWLGEEMHRNGAHKNADQAYDKFLKNVGHFHNLKICKGYSVEMAKDFKDKSIDMVFIDGSHPYDDVDSDIKAWLPKTIKLICGHDAFASQVMNAVKDNLGKPERHGDIWYKWLNDSS